MPTVTIKIKHARIEEFFDADVTAKGPTSTIKDEFIPKSGNTLELEIGTYHFDGRTREGNNSRNIKRKIRITAGTKEALIFRPIMGEECRIWLEDIKRLIKKGERQKVIKEITLAKKVYKYLQPPLPEEIVAILELEKEISGV